jgi:hypothetical protein
VTSGGLADWVAGRRDELPARSWLVIAVAGLIVVADAFAAAAMSQSRRSMTLRSLRRRRRHAARGEAAV